MCGEWLHDEHLDVPFQHTLASLARLDLLLLRQVRYLRALQPNSFDDFRGLYVSDEDVDAMLCGSLRAAQLLDSVSPEDPDSAGWARAMSSVESQVATLEQQAADRGEALPLLRLAELFGLCQREREILLVCLATEVDLKYERLYAYLQDDVTKKRPTVDLVMRLLCGTVEERLAWRTLFDPGAPLMRWELITTHEDPSSWRASRLSRYLKLDERVAGFCLGSTDTEPRLAPFVLSFPQQGDLVPPTVAQRISRWASRWTKSWPDVSPVILFHGRYGTGKRASAQYLADQLGHPLLALSARALAASDLPLVHGLRLAEREALMTGALLCYDHADDLLLHRPENEQAHSVFAKALANGRAPTVLLADKPWEPAQELERRPFLRLELPDLSYAERHSSWTANLDGAGPRLDERYLDVLPSRFRLTHGQIGDAVARARTIAWSRNPNHSAIRAEDVDEACRSQAQHRLSSLATKISPHYAWRDIVLPENRLAMLRLMCATVRQRATVYGDWGFDRKLSLGKGLIALFAGPSGTGKTMAADIIANELGLDLFKINLSAVVSKYIGETEQNLERIFGEAQDSDVILFFDEADALFGKRSEVKDAHDRYANIEIAYLLQRTEEYNGLVILASNVQKNMDEAFVRRIHFVVDFPFPEEAQRREIWERTFPQEAPRAEDIDLGFLASRLRITGGSIRNTILTAAILAAEDEQAIAMRHLVRAAAYEFQKTGKLIAERDFGAYYEMARG